MPTDSQKAASDESPYLAQLRAAGASPEEIARHQRKLRRPPAKDVLSALTLLGVKDKPLVIGEIGAGYGRTSLGVAKALAGRGELHLFDFEAKLAPILAELRSLGFSNVFTHPNTTRSWDSYNWNLAKLVEGGRHESFDLFYIDGAHTFFHDALAFFLCDRLLKVGGILVMDDYDWSYASAGLHPNRNMTPEQLATAQIKLVVDHFIEPHGSYEPVVPKSTYRKVQSTWRDTGRSLA